MTQKYFLWQDFDSIDSLEIALNRGKVVLFASDTVLGLSAPLTLAGFEALDRIKGRAKKPYLIILGDKQSLSRYCQIPFSDQTEKLIAFCWPGPLTLILPAKQNIAPFLAREGSIAIRIPAHKGLLELLNRVGGLFSTSANISGVSIPETVDQVDAKILEQVGLVVIDQNRACAMPSTILDCTTHQKIKLVREGAYSVSMLEKICGKIV